MVTTCFGCKEPFDTHNGGTRCPSCEHAFCAKCVGKAFIKVNVYDAHAVKLTHIPAEQCVACGAVLLVG